MLCSSPMSANTLSNTESSVPTFAGTNMPACAMSVNSPMVLSVTVLPPVFGPVMMRVVNSVPSHTSMGTTRKPGINGCLPLTMRSLPSELSLGCTARYSLASLALAKMRSILPSVIRSV